MSNLIAVLHHSKNGFILPSIKQILVSAKTKSIESVFCSEYINPNEKEFLNQHEITYIRKTNHLRDFGSLKLVYDYIVSKKLIKIIDKLIVLNTSMVSLNKVSTDDDWFQFLINRKEDFLGITDSISISYHIQTYHYSISKRFLTSNTFKNFIQNLNTNSKNRANIIKTCEIGLAKLAQRDNFTIKSFMPLMEINSNQYLRNFKDFLKYLEDLFPLSKSFNDEKEFLIKSSFFLKEYAHNPTHYRCYQLLFKDYPFLKRELLESNPKGFNIVPFLIPLSNYLNFDYENSDLMQIASELNYSGGKKRKLFRLWRSLKYNTKFKMFENPFDNI